MIEYPFNLQGRQEIFSGSGHKESESTKSKEFSLTQGVIIAEIEHHGDGDFKLEFVPAEGFGKGIAVAAKVAGAGLSGPVGYFVGSKVGKAITNIWTPVDSKGKLNTRAIAQIKKDFLTRTIAQAKEYKGNFLGPGKYRIEVKSQDRWTCRFIQPDLEQSSVTLKREESDFNEDGDAGVHILGPLKSGSGPVRVRVRHSGRGKFSAVAYSVDGIHQCIVYQDEGQFQIEDHPTEEIKPGKEYMLYILADGGWNLNFTEGY